MAANSDIAQQKLVAQLQSPGVDPLYKYANNIAIIHCPGDTRYKFLAPGHGWAYDSYSKCENVGGEAYGNYWGQGASYSTITSVASPVSTFYFREDDDSRGLNEGTWVLNWQATTPTPAPFAHPQSFTWEDPIPMYHGNVSTASFVDGHAECYTWGDKARSITACQLRRAALPFSIRPIPQTLPRITIIFIKAFVFRAGNNKSTSLKGIQDAADIRKTAVLLRKMAWRFFGGNLCFTEIVPLNLP